MKVSLNVELEVTDDLRSAVWFFLEHREGRASRDQVRAFLVSSLAALAGLIVQKYRAQRDSRPSSVALFETLKTLRDLAPEGGGQ